MREFFALVWIGLCCDNAQYCRQVACKSPIFNRHSIPRIRGKLSQSIITHQRKVVVEQQERLFIINWSETEAKGKQYFCVLDPDAVHIHCTDADEPMYIEGSVSDDTMQFMYVENGVRSDLHQNSFTMAWAILHRTD